MSDLFDLYFKYQQNREPPPIFHRWALASCIGAWMGRQVWFPFGTSRIFPNVFVMFVGDPGSRKTTAINEASELLRLAGYDYFGPQRSSKEKFLTDLAGEPEELAVPTKKRGFDMLEDIEVLPTMQDDTPREIFLNVDEFNNFMGPGNIEFQSILGELWDWDKPTRPYRYRLKNSRSVDIFQPTVSILAGNTPSNFALCFPPASIGQGFMSRLLLIPGEATGLKVTFPEPHIESETEELIRRLKAMKMQRHGPMTMTQVAKQQLDTIYRTWPELSDQRFKHYSTRRFTHLLKLCMIFALASNKQEIDTQEVLRANTVLAYAESLMPKALGELGKSRHSEAANKIMQALYSAKKPMTMQELWMVVHMDLEHPRDLNQVLNNLDFSEKVQLVRNEIDKQPGYIARRKTIARQVLFVYPTYLKGRELPK